MRRNTVRPTGVERTLGRDDLIVTKTDPRGHITYANETFLTISALTEAETLGQPHSIIRHPDMPRAIYHLLWSTIQGGQEIFAYVQNLAADGAHYWVLAHVTPTFDRQGTLVGYHSNRRQPARSALPEVQALYRRARSADPGGGGAAGAERAGAVLTELLADMGTTYRDWVWSLEPAEVVA